ncbi:MAG: hypothetical protein LBK66_06605 [Spirochaetaceae bacterium]|nr:hypothetical protein [Spirochaetaceae bacterium]
MRRLICIAVLLFFCGKNGVSAQDTIDLSRISKDKLVVFADLKNENKEEILELLLVGIEISVDNIVNANTTRISDGLFPYKYKYLIVSPDLSFSVGERDEYKILYYPTHPDSIKDGDLKGHVLYPAINVEREYSDILEMTAYIRSLSEGNIGISE